MGMLSKRAITEGGFKMTDDQRPFAKRKLAKAVEHEADTPDDCEDSLQKSGQAGSAETQGGIAEHQGGGIPCAIGGGQSGQGGG
jgi:hypothetical protein